MAVNPDPKPGRWILPLVILGMVAFTYFFVRELPEASTETTLVSSPGTSTTTAGPGDGSTSTTGATTPVDPAAQAYIDAINAINQELQVQRTELVTVNNAFNQDPREVEFPEAEDRFEAVATETQALADQMRGLTPPTGLEANQDSLQTALDTSVASINEALAGLRSTDTGERRNGAVDAYVQAATDYETEVTNTLNAASSG